MNDVKLKHENLAEMRYEHAKPGSDLCNSECNFMIDLAENGVLTGGNIACSVAATSDVSDITSTTRERLSFLKYIVDPNRFKFSKVVRIVAMVIKCCKLFLSGINRQLTCFPDSNVEPHEQKFISKVNVAEEMKLSDDEIKTSLKYFYRKSTEELKNFVDSKVYDRHSYEKDDIIYYTGRVSNSDISYECKMTDKMIDLSKDMFIVPIIDRHSPVAYAIVNQFHWEESTVKHSGIETTIRAIMSVAHILKMRELVKLIKKNCKR